MRNGDTPVQPKHFRADAPEKTISARADSAGLHKLAKTAITEGHAKLGAMAPKRLSRKMEKSRDVCKRLQLAAVAQP